MKQLFFFLILLLTYSITAMSQQNVKEYYHNVNCAIEKFVKNDYEGSLIDLMKNESSFFFSEEINLFKSALDSVGIENSSKEIRSFAANLPSITTPPVHIVTNNEVIDNGIANQTINSREMMTTMNDHYLSSIISLDRYLSFVRTNVNSAETIDSLYELAAINTMNVFQTISLPSRLETSYWNDNLMLAISHSLNSLSNSNQDAFLAKLKEHVWLGNIHTQQYALWYDEVYATRNNNKTFYGIGFTAELISVDPMKFNSKAKPIKNIKKVNTRRSELMLGNLTTWYKFKNISYDFDID